MPAYNMTVKAIWQEYKRKVRKETKYIDIELKNTYTATVRYAMYYRVISGKNTSSLNLSLAEESKDALQDTIGASEEKTVSIKIVNNSDNDLDGALGDFVNLAHRIRLAKTYINDKGTMSNIPDDEFIKTYLHELGHCFGYYFNGDSSEELACAFSNFFYEYLLTKK